MCELPDIQSRPPSRGAFGEFARGGCCPRCAGLEAFEVDVDDGRDVERQQLRDEQAADHGDAERAARFGSGSDAEAASFGAIMKLNLNFGVRVKQAIRLWMQVCEN